MAALLKALREERGWTQSELGERLTPPVSFAAVSSWERGEKRIPRTRLKDMSKVLEVPPESFTQGPTYVFDDSRTKYGQAIIMHGFSDATEAVGVRLALHVGLTKDRGNGLEFIGSLDDIAETSANLDNDMVLEAITALMDAGFLVRVTNADWHLALVFPEE